MADFSGTGGNDYFVATTSSDLFDGGPGLDVVNEFVTGRRNGTVAVQANGDVTFTQGAQVDTFRGIEQVDFIDGRLVFNLDDSALQVVRLYNAALDRGPDQGGLNSYVNQLESGVPLSTLAGNFLASPEFVSRFGDNLAGQQYIERLYDNVLDRAPSGGEISFYLDQINQGATRQQLLVNFSESPENRAKTAGLAQGGVWDYNENAGAVARIYDTMFDRAPELAGLRFYREQLDSGTNTLLGIVEGFVASPEFQSRYGTAVSGDAFVRLLYRNTLNRDPVQSEVDFYAPRLDSGELSRAQTVLGFAESPEHKDLTSPNISSEVPSQFGILFT